MTKQELIQHIKDLKEGYGVTFSELLDDGRRNERMVIGSKEKLIKVLEEKFDDELHGHFGDNVMTTIQALQIYIMSITEL